MWNSACIRTPDFATGTPVRLCAQTQGRNNVLTNVLVTVKIEPAELAMLASQCLVQRKIQCPEMSKRVQEHLQKMCCKWNSRLHVTEYNEKH